MSPEGAQWPWAVLGLERMPQEISDIRRAYARALKAIDQTTDIEGFTELRRAYEYAMAAREQRTVDGARRSGRKFEALVPKPTTRPPETFNPTPGTAAPIPEPEEPARQRNDADKDIWLRRIVGQSLVEGKNATVARLFDTPLPSGLDTAEPIQFALAEMVRQWLQEEEDGVDTKDPLSRATLRLLDRHYGWLSDYKAFERVFGRDGNLLNMAFTRAHGPILPSPNRVHLTDIPDDFDRPYAKGLYGWVVLLVCLSVLWEFWADGVDTPLWIVFLGLLILFVVVSILAAVFLLARAMISGVRDWIAVRRSRRRGR